MHEKLSIGDLPQAAWVRWQPVVQMAGGACGGGGGCGSGGGGGPSGGGPGGPGGGAGTGRSGGGGGGGLSGYGLLVFAGVVLLCCVAAGYGSAAIDAALVGVLVFLLTADPKRAKGE